MFVKLEGASKLMIIGFIVASLFTACDDNPTTTNVVQPSRTPTSTFIAAPSESPKLSFSNVTLGPVVTPNILTQITITPTIIQDQLSPNTLDQNSSSKLTYSTPIPPTPGQLTATITSSKKVTDFPCIAIDRFAIVNGPYNQLIGKRVCMEAQISSARARLPGGDVYIDFKNYSHLDGIIQAEIRERFKKDFLDSLKDKRVRIYGIIVKSDILRVPILQIDWPEQIEILP